MIFRTQLRRYSDPLTMHNVIVYADDIKAKFLFESNSPLDFFQLRIRVHSDVGATGEPDDIDAPWPESDIEKIFYASEGQKVTVSNRLRGSGNLMQGVRIYCKAQVLAWNESVFPGGPAAVHVDVDNDNPV